ncbi:hypothetical protein AKKGGB_AKKGGB_05765, partial [Dysosmobacter welbionis]
GVGGDGDAVVRVAGAHGIADLVDDLRLSGCPAKEGREDLRSGPQDAGGAGGAHCQHQHRRSGDQGYPADGAASGPGLLPRRLSGPAGDGGLFLLCKVQAVQGLLIFKRAVHSHILPKVLSASSVPGPAGCGRLRWGCPGFDRS